jgi:hypothetical protein
VFEAPTVIASLDDVAMMGDAIQERGGHFEIIKHGGPFAKGEIGGDDDAGLLTQLADQMEQQLAARSSDRQIAQLVEYDQIETG